MEECRAVGKAHPTGDDSRQNARTSAAAPLMLSLLRTVLVNSHAETPTPESGTEPGIPGDAWEDLYALCREQNLIGFLYRAAASDANVPEAVRAKIQRQYLLSVAQQVQQDYYRAQIFAALAAAGIRYLPLKGEDLRAVYPATDLRFSCDIDFFYDATR